jgi:hypothetical protein
MKGLYGKENEITRLTAASDTDYQLLAHGRWFSPGTSASSITKTGGHEPFFVTCELTEQHEYKHRR